MEGQPEVVTERSDGRRSGREELRKDQWWRPGETSKAGEGARKVKVKAQRVVGEEKLGAKRIGKVEGQTSWSVEGGFGVLESIAVAPPTKAPGCLKRKISAEGSFSAGRDVCST